MGTLIDITTSANNANPHSIKPQPRVPKSSIKTNEPKIGINTENQKNGKMSSQGSKYASPRFMSSTISSSTSVTTPLPKMLSGTRTSNNSIPSTIKGRNWVTTAVKRVGIGRTTDKTSRSKENESLQSRRSTTNSDKVVTLKPTQIQEALRSVDVTTEVFHNKPLPRPPIAYIMTKSPIKQSRSLLDASEQPLWRSPPDEFQKEEEWPVLFPEKPTTPGTLREMTRSDSTNLLVKVFSGKEDTKRFSFNENSAKMDVASTENGIASAPVNGNSPNHATVNPEGRIQCKPVEAFGQPPKELQMDVNLAVPVIAGTKSPSRKGRTNDPTSLNIEHFNQASDMSPSAAAIEKSEADSTTNFSHRRQTRTSSLRTRISAGSLVTEGQGTTTKVLGFTDFTVLNEDMGTTHHRNSRGPSRSPTPYRSPTVPRRMTSGRQADHTRGGRGPAKIIAGGRRPEMYYPGARSPHKDVREVSLDARGCPPTRPPPVIASMKPRGEAQLVAVRGLPKGEIAHPETRRCSISTFHHAVSGLTGGTESEASQAVLDEPSPEAKQPVSKDFAIYQDHISAETDIDSDTDSLNKSGVSNEPKATSVRASPQDGYRTKRLSLISPGHGAILKISADADKVIIGPSENSDKENQVGHRKVKKGKDLRRAVVTNELRKASEDIHERRVANKTLVVRPRSSSGDLFSALPRKAEAVQVRNHRATSTDVASLVSKADSTEKLPKGIITKSSEDPFVSSPRTSQERSDSNKNPSSSDLSMEQGPFVLVNGPCSNEKAMLSSNTGDAGQTSFNQKNGIMTALLPIVMQDSITANSYIKVPGGRGAHIFSTASGTSDPSGGKEKDLAVSQTSSKAREPAHGKKSPADPKATPNNPFFLDNGSTEFSHPPRVSSRLPPTDNNVLFRRTLSSDFAKDFTETQNKLDSAIGIKPSQIDSIFKETRHVNVNRTPKEHDPAKRMSQGSFSKAKHSMANLVGLFHKRSSDQKAKKDSVAKSTKKPKKVSVTATGSPYPTLNGNWSAYGPTQASQGRSATPAEKRALLAEPQVSLDSPFLTLPERNEISYSTSMAVAVLQAAREESQSPKKERLLAIGKVMVDVITNARETEKSMEHAKQAANKAEVSYMMAKKSVMDVTRMVQEWREAADREPRV
ncbi:MAG: hypothetical protein M1827_001224 [Pycnora praestabilis]|nr:MAG: hypothetical protein M1827_001224 [Pycnora praestabilis]